MTVGVAHHNGSPLSTSVSKPVGEVLTSTSSTTNVSPVGSPMSACGQRFHHARTVSWSVVAASRHLTSGLSLARQGKTRQPRDAYPAALTISIKRLYVALSTRFMARLARRRSRHDNRPL